MHTGLVRKQHKDYHFTWKINKHTAQRLAFLGTNKNREVFAAVVFEIFLYFDADCPSN